ncbi:hypothetical protein ACE2AJ_17825 [Aquihabitans daechungensis]|uniref:hypothetical protein n=1 Tax=Aquihabitans daechungensis TaxID=1052257 RepID=UPI003BA109E1
MHAVVRRLIAVAATAVVAALALTGCGGGESHVALAIQEAERPSGTVLLTVECADDLDVEQQIDPAGSGLQQVTVWGDPQTGTCDPQVELDDLAADQFVDGATSQVVTIQASNPEPGT